jgi:hypothetical protein
MKKIITTAIFCLILLLPARASAKELKVSALVEGDMKVGQEIQILIQIDSIESFFAGSMYYKYDSNVLKVLTVERGDLIASGQIPSFEAFNEIDNEAAMVRFGFTCLGNIKGYSGEGAFVKIKAVLLKEEGFHINSKPFMKAAGDEFNLKLQLCNSDIDELNYTFTPYVYKAAAGTGGSTGGGTDNNTGTTSPQPQQGNSGQREPAGEAVESPGQNTGDSSQNTGDSGQNTENLGGSSKGDQATDTQVTPGVKDDVEQDTKNGSINSSENTSAKGKSFSGIRIGISILTILIIAAIVIFSVINSRRQRHADI